MKWLLVLLFQQETVRSDLIQMILDGEQHRKNIHEILGGDYKNMVDEIINSFPLVFLSL